jgi:hypothetical protein
MVLEWKLTFAREFYRRAQEPISFRGVLWISPLLSRERARRISSVAISYT